MDETTNELPGVRIMRQFLPSSPYVSHLGIELADAEAGGATLTLPYREALATMGNVVHGGAIASLVDTAAMVAAWAGAEVPDRIRGSTVGMTVNYLSPGAGEDLHAEARVIRQGRNLVHVEVDVRTGSGTAVARGLVTYKLG